jgi:hypothetical protein
MKNKLITLVIFITYSIGLILSLIQLYAASDEIIHPQLASYFYFGSGVILLGLINLQKNISNKLKGINSFIIFFFALSGIVLALICLYSLDDGKLVDTFAGAIFFLSGMLPASYIFVLFKASNKY